MEESAGVRGVLGRATTRIILLEGFQGIGAAVDSLPGRTLLDGRRKDRFRPLGLRSQQQGARVVFVVGGPAVPLGRLRGVLLVLRYRGSTRLISQLSTAR